MKKTAFLIAMLAILMAMLSACATTGQPQAATANALTPSASDSAAPSGVQARPGSGVTGDPSGNLQDLVEVKGTAKEVKEGLVLITLEDKSDFMLRFSENTQWADGVDKTIKQGNTVDCLVKPEPTFTTPSQGEVFRVLENKLPG